MGHLYDDPFSLGEIVGLACVGGILYAVAAWYLGNVLPSAHGTPLPWWFPFDAAYWRSAGRARARAPTRAADGCASKGRAMLVDEFDDANANAIGASSMSTEAAAVEDAAAANGAAMEPAEGRRAAVVIRGVSKTYNPEGDGARGGTARARPRARCVRSTWRCTRDR